MGLWDLKATKKMNSLSTAKGNRTQKPWTVARGPLEHARLPLKEMLAWALTEDRDWGLQVQGGVGYLHSFLSSPALVPRCLIGKLFGSICHPYGWKTVVDGVEHSACLPQPLALPVPRRKEGLPFE